MPSYIVTIAERRTYEVEAGSEAEALDLFGEDEAEHDIPIGSLRSIERSAIEVSIRDDGDPDPPPADRHHEATTDVRGDARLPFSRGT